jgi:hypothetical protein
MSRSHRRTIGVAASATLIASLVIVVAGQSSRREADAIRQKIATITALGDRPSKQPRQTALSERELNVLLADDAAGLQLPMGVVEPTVAILGAGRVSASAIVDLDAVRKQRSPTSMLDPMSYVSGRLPVTATGLLRTGNGVGRFQLESAAVGGVPLPKVALQEIVNYYSRTPENPQGIALDDPFPLPANIREIRVDGGQAIIVQ